MTTVIRSADAGQPGLYVLKLPPGLLQDEEIPTAFGIPVLQRSGGFLMAIPPGYVEPSVLADGLDPNSTTMFGPSTEISVLGMEEVGDGSETLLGVDLKVVLVDCMDSMKSHMKEFDPSMDQAPAAAFFGESPAVLPSSNSLLAQALEWISSQDQVNERVMYYSAAEEEVVIPTRQAQSPVKAKAKSATAPKKVTNAILAEQVGSLSALLPQLSAQLKDVQERQSMMEKSMIGAQVPELPAHRQPFPVPPTLMASVPKFISAIGPPPKVRSAAPMTPLRQNLVPEDEPQLIPSEEGYLNAVAQQVVPPDVSGALLQQGQALGALVAHLIGQESYADLAAPGSASSMSIRGSTKRERLQAELAARSGNFLLQVAQHAHRRLKPTEPTPSDLGSFSKRAIFSKYLERQGGFQGQRDLGLFAWLLAQIGDQMVNGDDKGAQEMLALALVTVEQAAQDGGRWELAWVLSLQEDPPQSLFHAKSQATNPRVRAFAPLCPAPWATICLSYVKELDVIASKRLEAIPSKKTFSSEKEKQPEGEGGGKKKNRFPKKPKANMESSG